MKPLQNAVEQYIQKDMARFHMPGHKGKGSGVWKEILRYDITEVEGADSLFHADGPLLALEQQFAKAYGTRRTLLSAGGATLCIQTMLALACGIGKKVVMSRNIHRAAINACALLDLQPVWLYPEPDAGDWFSGRYTGAALETLLQKNPDAAAVYLTSPDYFGVFSDIRGLAAVCARYGLPLLVDNAHGAHLKFLPQGYGKWHPADCGAAICCDSLHKTLPAMTGGALLHIMDERYIAQAKERMSLFGSTSPSYPIMLSCEHALEYAQKEAARDFAWTAYRFGRIRQIALEKGMACPQGECDPAKLSVAFAAAGFTAGEFGEYLRGNSIEPEYISNTACVWMGNGKNSLRDYERLEKAFAHLEPKRHTAAPQLVLPRPKQVCSVREAVFAPAEWVDTEQALGRVAAGENSPCPPGIPVVMGGERIDRQTQEALLAYGVRRVWAIR